MSYPCIYNEEGTCKLHSTVYEHSWCVEGPCDDQTLSNGGRIRGMSDEELAHWIDFCPHDNCPKVGCHACILNWLKQPCEVDHDTD